MASLFVIQGADQGKRFELKARPMALGRDGSNPIRLHDNEVSRRHAELRPADDALASPGAYQVVDLGSANGTFVNGRPVEQAPLKAGDHLRLGQTVMLYSDGAPAGGRDPTERVDVLSRTSPDDRSAIVRSISAADGSRVIEAPGNAADWLKVRLANLAVMYQTTQAISHILDNDALLAQILQLVFESIGADRGAILLDDEAGELVPKAVRWRGEADPDERLTISRTIVEHVLTPGPGRHHLRRPGRRALRARAVDRRFQHPRGDLRPDPGPTRDPRRPLRRHARARKTIDRRPPSPANRPLRRGNSRRTT